MRHTVDLGQCHLHASESLIQVHFAATANLNYLTYPSTETDPYPPQWPDPTTSWVTEAPELQLCFFVRFDLRLGHIGPQLISSLDKMLCNSKVWLNLGFTIAPKSHGLSTNPDYPDEYLLVFGLYRTFTMPSATKTRFLSAILQNPPDTHAPQGVPVVSLTAVEISLDCGFLFHSEKNPHERRNVVDNKNEPWFYFSSCPNLAADSILDSHAGFANFTENDIIPLEDRIDHSSQSLHALVDFCLQKLLSSATTKFSGIHVIGNNLQTLQKLAPAIFNPEYREAMNQRSVSCPIIAKAVNSMLATTSNPILLKEGIKTHRNGKQWIADSLWCMAQTNLRQLKVGNKVGSFRSQGQGTDEPQTNDERAITASFTEDIFDEGEILDLDNDWSLDIDNEWELETYPQILRTDVDDESDGPLLGSSGESSFQDLYESTQTTLDSLPLPEIIPSQLTDTEMLLFDCDLE